MNLRRLMRIALAAGAVALLASCAAIPGSGPVNVGLTDLQQAERTVQFSVSGPVSGATQEDLVRGFMLAAASSTDDYAVAREFLTTTYANEWDPRYGVLVVEGSSPYRVDDEMTGTLTLSVTAKVDADGSMLPAEPGRSTDLRFEFERQAGEWRISSAPAGIILNKDHFNLLWDAHQLAFLGPGGRMVPETRWFLSRASLASEIVGALIAGPGERLREVARSSIPPGVSLTNSAVPVVDGRARVDLTGEGLGNPDAQQEILRQLKVSLQAVPGVTSVELLIDGASVREEKEPPANTVFSSTAVRLAGSIDERFGLITSKGVEPVTDISEVVQSLSPNAAALSRSTTVAAVRNAEGVSIVTGGASRLVDTRRDVLEPSVDDDLWTWTVSPSAPEILRATSADGETIELQAPWLAGASVAAVRIAPGGSLIAALVNDGDKSFVLVGGIIRHADGTPSGISAEADTELWVNGAALDFDWIDQLRFVVLTKQSNAGKITGGGPGIFSFEQGSVLDAVHIAGGGTRAQLRVLSSDGMLYSPQGASGWQRANSGVTLLAKRG